MFKIAIGENAALYDSTSVYLGDFNIEEIRSDAFCGSFVPSSAFGSVRALFTEFSEAVNSISIVRASEIAVEIQKLGIWAQISEKKFRINDLQLYEESNRFVGSFRQAA